jgi:hypothetical protein
VTRRRSTARLGAAGVGAVIVALVVVLAFSKTHTDSAASPLLGKVSQDVVEAILGVDASYIASALATVDERHGSLPRYLHDELGVTERDVRTLQDHLLE